MTEKNDNATTAETLDLGRVLRECHEKEEFNFALFQHNPSAITIVDREGRVVKSNLARRHAHDPLPDLGKSLFSGDSDCDLIMKGELKKALDLNIVREVSDVRSGGHIFSFTIAPFTQGAIVTRQDITEQKRAEAQLVQAQKLAALGTLVSGVAHEVSNPNNVMLLSLKTLQRIVEDLRPILDERKEKEGDFDLSIGSYSEIREDIPEMVASCYRAAERINRLVTDLKCYARRDDGVVLDLFDVNAIVQSAANLMGVTIRKATHNFKLKCADDLPSVRGTARRIEQVVINLLSNACQALPNRDCGITLSTAYSPAAHEVYITVQDEGEGIPPESLPQVTDPFFTTKHDTGGTGLGLSISRQIAENHGGALVFSSTGGHGTLVTLTLPAPRDSEETAA